MFSEQEKALIRDAHLALVERSGVSAGSKELKNINLAYEWASKTYNGQRMANGKPYILHLIELANITVEEIGLGTTTVISAFLHGINLKSDFNLNQIEEKFGRSVRLIVDGFNRVSQMRTERLGFQSDTFRKLFLTLVDDIRVILLKIAHRLYDVRNPEDIDSEKYKLFIQEVKHLYIPISHRLGLYRVKAEFEEKVMMYETPEIYFDIKEQLQATKVKQEAFIKDFLAPIERELIAQGFDCNVKWRTKSIPSIYAKMKAQNVDFDQVYDIFAVRIITKSKPRKEKEDCWRVYSIVTDIYQPNPKRLRDWITTPKASGYESLHTTVKDSESKRWVEVQVRSERMDEIAEKGQAAHWRYKGTDKKKDMEDWLNQVRDVLENPEQINFDYRYRNAPKPENEKIFIFTPNGDLKQLPVDSTVLDFAYEVHTKVGETCNGARVNNKNVPIRHRLQNGDKVEIITSKKQRPKQDWLGFVVTERARSKIKKFVREENLRESEIGRDLLQRKLKNWKMPFNDQGINNLVKHFKTDTAIELYHQIATEEIDLQDVKKCLADFLEAESEKQSGRNKTEDTIVFRQPVKDEAKNNEDFLVIDQSLKNVNYKLAKCCNPIPGDTVFGFVTIGSGITIHRVNCPNASRLVEKYSYRILKVRWRGESENPVFNVAIRVVGKDVLGLVGDVTKVISNDLKVNMRSLQFDTHDGQFEGNIHLQIKDTVHLEQLMHKLLKVNGVSKCTRIK